MTTPRTKRHHRRAPYVHTLLAYITSAGRPGLHPLQTTNSPTQCHQPASRHTFLLRSLASPINARTVRRACSRSAPSGDTCPHLASSSDVAFMFHHKCDYASRFYLDYLPLLYTSYDKFISHDVRTSSHMTTGSLTGGYQPVWQAANALVACQKLSRVNQLSYLTLDPLVHSPALTVQPASNHLRANHGRTVQLRSLTAASRHSATTKTSTPTSWRS